MFNTIGNNNTMETLETNAHLSNTSSYIWNLEFDAKIGDMIEILNDNQNDRKFNNILFQSTSRGGKTKLLENIHLNVRNCKYIDFSDSAFKDRGVSSVFDICAEFFSDSDAIYLIDNIDDLLLHPVNSNLPYRYLVTAIIDLLDHCKSKNNVILGTCTSLDRIHPSLLQPYRFEMIYIPLPSTQTRALIFERNIRNRTLFQHMLTSSSSADIYEQVSSVSNKLALLTQGLSYGDILDIMDKGCLDIVTKRIIHGGTSSFGEEFDDILSSAKQYRSEAVNIVDDYRIDFQCEPVCAGYDDTLNQMQDMLLSSDDSSICSAGMLIEGPSGVGKTTIVHRLAYQNKDRLRFIALSCADLIHKVVGESEKKLASIFAAARSIAPCILLLDNIDVIIGVNNGDDTQHNRTSHKAIDRILSTLLVEIDGLSSSSNMYQHHISSMYDIKADDENRPVIVIATALSASSIDRALRRSGRLEDHISLALPDVCQRIAIIKQYIKGISFMSSIEQSYSVNTLVDEISVSMKSRNCAEIRQSIQEVAMACIRNLEAAQLIGSSHANDEVYAKILIQELRKICNT